MSVCRILFVVVVVGVLFKQCAATPPLEYSQYPDYYSPPYIPAVTPSVEIEGDFGQQVLAYAQTGEARGLIDTLGSQYLLELQPDVVAIVRKLQSEGNDYETSKRYASVLLAWIVDGCAHLSKEGQQDFAMALVEASMQQRAPHGSENQQQGGRHESVRF